jgi:peptidoglycan/xylan/chitin deacetylase (PgdA/CDA1 family)
MTEDNLRQIAATDGLEIGAHTVSHPSLPTLDAKDLLCEVERSKRQCEDLIGRSITGFAYPFGDFNANSIAAVRAAGLSYACTTVPREIGPRTDPFAIPRVMVANWEEDEFQNKVLIYG